MTTYALTGTTGHFGRIAVQQLVQQVGAQHVVALARNVAKAQALVPAGVTVRAGDYDDVAQLTAGLQGVDRLLFVSSQPGGAVSRQQQHQNVIAAAKAAGVGYLAYTSFPHADTATAALAADHQATEAAIKDSGIKHSFLRNNWYLENEAATLQAATSGQPFVYAAGDGQVGWALESEYAQAAVNVLTTAAPKAVYEFAGPMRTYRDLAAAITGDFDVQALTISDYQQSLADAGMPADIAAVVAAIQALIRDGQLQETTTDLPDVLGHELTPLAAAVQKVLGV
ncbi:NAD(P)H-binding protein [Lacticaseibacillus baoqingensis]|uniref:NAD(P)H-binding protein n=1 Tax=Lacticaseibacillus baoqingensis TaxID=2486013 RepID=A0ABW4E9F6_9LACO|nr:NAD(P)H-binding protein [Lacticaseibacillus baoqingensis]